MSKLKIRFSLIGTSLRKDAYITINAPMMVEGMLIYPTGDKGELIVVEARNGLSYFADEDLYYLVDKTTIHTDEGVLKRAVQLKTDGWEVYE
jgi:hypothetical protein